MSRGAFCWPIEERTRAVTIENTLSHPQVTTSNSWQPDRDTDSEWSAVRSHRSKLHSVLMLRTMRSEECYTHSSGFDKAGKTAIAMTRTKATMVVTARIMARIVVS